jgi:ADP-heptose:LPS heptosyltransferase
VTGSRRRHVLVVRLDRLGDMLICGPAIRAVAATADRVTVLAAPAGAPAARLLPGVDEVIEWNCPWIAAPPPAVDAADVRKLVARLADARIDEALILTSFHQNALPTALLLRMAGIDRVAAVSEDYPGSLLDVRIAPPGDAPEPVRMLQIAAAAGYRLPAGDDGRLALRTATDAPDGTPPEPFVAVHPGVDAPARGCPEPLWREAVAALTRSGRTVVVTGSREEAPLAARVAAAAKPPGRAVLLAGCTDVAGLAAVLRQADVLVSANTGPAHLAAAVRTPVVSLFAPVVPAVRWAPYGVPVRLLGDQQAPCAGSRARVCPVPGHPCLAEIGADEICAAVDALAAPVAAAVAG